MTKRLVASIQPMTAPEDQAARKRKLYPEVRPPQFWDNLSKCHLTRSALRELDRRNLENSAPSSRYFPRRGRSRKVDGSDKLEETLGHLSSTALRDIKRFARQGGPNLQELRSMSSSQVLGRRKRGSQSPRKKGSHFSANPDARTLTTGTKSTGPYDRTFLQHLIDFNIFPPEYEYPDGTVPPAPTNVDEILTALSQDPSSVFPSDLRSENFRKLKRADAQASNESDVTSVAVPIIEGDVGDRKCTAGHTAFTNLDHLTDGTIVAGNPDRYYGARPEQLKRNIREELGGKIVPSTQRDLPIAPNFFLQVKGPDGTAAVARRQAYYDGALGARGMQCLRRYVANEPEFDGKAYTLTSIYQDGQLTMFACHPIPPREPAGFSGYVLTQLKAFALTGDEEDFQRGIAAYRNGRDWTKQQRDGIIKRVNEAESKGLVRTKALGCTASSFTSEASTAETVVTSQGIAVLESEPTGDSEGSEDERV
ncbi:hypothetical protein V2A60_000655 [Cordyceps javanica]